MCKMLFKKCCFFVPPKIGILIWAYINMLTLLVPIGFYGYVSLILIAFYGLDSNIANILGVLLIFSLELAFIILLIVGVHKEHITMLKSFFYYSLISTLIEIVLFTWYTRCSDEFYNPDLILVTTIFVIIFAVLKIYITFVLQFVINKLKNKYKIESEDYENDAQCVLDMTQEKERFERKD